MPTWVTAEVHNRGLASGNNQILNSSLKTCYPFITLLCFQIVECRRVLKWTYAYGYYLPEYEQGKRVFFEYLQGMLFPQAWSKIIWSFCFLPITYSLCRWGRVRVGTPSSMCRKGATSLPQCRGPIKRLQWVPHQTCWTYQVLT